MRSILASHPQPVRQIEGRRRRLALVLAVSLAVAACGVAPSPSAVPAPSLAVVPSPSAAPASPAASPSTPPAASASPTSSPASPSAAGRTPKPSPRPATAVSTSARPLVSQPAAYGASRFPAGYTGYHTYAQMVADIRGVALAHPDLVDLVSIGRSYQGATLWAARVSQDVHVDHGRPEALFDGLHHGLEHMSMEMTLAILHWLVDGYGHDAQVTSLLQTRAVDIVFAMNPDGAMYDISGGRFHEWRKNRQPGPGGAIGTDLNRNYADHWGCCGLVSSNPSSAYYRGTAPFSAPETGALAAFVQSRVIGGRQRISVAITFHTSGRLVMWPYGYTTAPVPSDMTADDHAVFVALGRAMAARNGYLAEQASGLYVDSGTARDWEYGREHIFAFTFELGTGLYQYSSVIGPETSRNRSAILYLIGMADCPYRAIGKQAQYCSAAAASALLGSVPDSWTIGAAMDPRRRSA